AILDCPVRVAGLIAVLRGARAPLRCLRQAQAGNRDDGLVPLARTETLGDLRNVAARSRAGKVPRRADDRPVRGRRLRGWRIRQGIEGRRREDVAEEGALAKGVG